MLTAEDADKWARKHANRFHNPIVFEPPTAEEFAEILEVVRQDMNRAWRRWMDSMNDELLYGVKHD